METGQVRSEQVKSRTMILDALSVQAWPSGVKVEVVGIANEVIILLSDGKNPTEARTGYGNAVSGVNHRVPEI